VIFGIHHAGGIRVNICQTKGHSSVEKLVSKRNRSTPEYFNAQKSENVELFQLNDTVNSSRCTNLFQALVAGGIADAVSH
jgi:hypothetical protein